jgi:gamma-tubulin complex component 4
MLHELLLALLGFTGDFVLDNSSSSSSARRRPSPAESVAAGDADAGPAFRLAPDLTFLQPSERYGRPETFPLLRICNRARDLWGLA